jgi:hypothetical protein
MADIANRIRPELTPLPVRMMHLPVDERGYVVPWFVAWVDGKPEFRTMDAQKWMQAVRHKLCWVCGTRLGAYLTFVIGPMCLINLTNSEPPSHLQCATWSAINCPFLSRPRMVRRENDMPAEAEGPAGIGILRNPGACAVYVVQGYRIFRDAAGKPLVRMPEEHTSIEWYAEGRKATRAQVQRSIDTGLPILMEMAEQEGPEAVAELKARAKRIEWWLPEE